VRGSDSTTPLKSHSLRIRSSSASSLDGVASSNLPTLYCVADLSKSSGALSHFEDLRLGTYAMDSSLRASGG